ncbi:MAG TPA: hypothetical protein VFN10_14965 [Thermoanaerobaculia bacterium]|nr:hypothetical protein [Thermoanaerobaculia bacterium]
MPQKAATSVFINVPFDGQYEPLFVTLVGTLVFLRHNPRCVLEVPESGQGRLARIFDLIGSCPMSFHDVSRVGTPVRFNMPFELGLACAVSLTSRRHEVFVMDSEAYRMDRTLSDYKGRDPLIHHGRCDDLVGVVLDVIGTKSVPPVNDLRSAARTLRQASRKIKREYKSETVFRASIFRSIVAAATEIARVRQFA